MRRTDCRSRRLALAAGDRVALQLSRRTRRGRRCDAARGRDRIETLSGAARAARRTRLRPRDAAGDGADRSRIAPHSADHDVYGFDLRPVYAVGISYNNADAPGRLHRARRGRTFHTLASWRGGGTPLLGLGERPWFGGSRTLPLALACVLVALVAFGFAAISPATPFWLAAALSVALGFTAEGWIGLGVIGMAEIGGEEHSGSALGVGLTWTLLAAFVTPTLFGALVELTAFHTRGAHWRSFNSPASCLHCSRVVALPRPRRRRPPLVRILIRNRLALEIRSRQGCVDLLEGGRGVGRN